MPSDMLSVWDRRAGQVGKSHYADRMISSMAAPNRSSYGRALAGLSIIVLCALSWGCTSDSVGTTSSSSALQASAAAGPDAPTYAVEAQAAAPAVSAAATSPADSKEYRISPRDILQITVFQVPDLTRAVQVDAAGTITLPLLKIVRVGGMTVGEAQDLLTQRLAKSYLRSPEVSVALVKSGQRVTVNGAVKTPQVITIDGELTLSQAIAQTGGLGETADASRIHVARMTGGSVRDEIYNLGEIQAGKAPDPRLIGGDILIAEESNAKVAFKNVKDLLPFAVIGSLVSDQRTKRNIVQLAQLPDGIGLYRFQYLWSDTVYVGVLAQQVQQVRPDAVVKGSDGYLRVDYGRLELEMQTCKVWMASRSQAQRSLSCWG